MLTRDVSAGRVETSRVLIPRVRGSSRACRTDITCDVLVYQAKRAFANCRSPGRIVIALDVCGTRRACRAGVVEYVLILRAQGSSAGRIASRGVVIRLICSSRCAADARKA